MDKNMCSHDFFPVGKSTIVADIVTEKLNLEIPVICTICKTYGKEKWCYIGTFNENGMLIEE